MSLFGATPELAAASARRIAPLAERMRPRTLDEYLGQKHLIGPGKPLRMQIETDDPASMIFWGPPGVGKTTLAKIIAETTHATFIEFSAVLSGIKEIKQVMVDAEKASHYGSRTILFVDEIHRFNKAQQDAFLPYVERGTIRLIGATTENPSFEIIAALLSRCRVYTLQPLTEEDLVTLLKRALTDERGLAKDNLTADDEALALIASYASGDGRSAYNALEIAAGSPPPNPSAASPARSPAKPCRSASCSTTRAANSTTTSSPPCTNPFVTVTWTHRSTGSAACSPRVKTRMYVARRLVRMASEDIGLAAPEALNLTLSARDAMDFLGSPEGELALAQAAAYLALAPKSNAVYTAWGAVTADIENTRAEPVPLHLRNAPTKLMRDLNYGKDYQYAHDIEGKVAGMDCLPENLRDRRYYQPTSEGREKLLKQRMG